MKRILLVSMLVLSLMVVSVGCAKSDESKIKDTVNGFFDALNDGNYEKALDYIEGADEMSQVLKDAIVDYLEHEWPSDIKMTVKSIEDVKVDGSEATASVVITSEGEDSEPMEVSFVKEDGSWKFSQDFFD